jgi:DNA-binding response OmpR family regulator
VGLELGADDYLIKPFLLTIDTQLAIEVLCS